MILKTVYILFILLYFLFIKVLTFFFNLFHVRYLFVRNSNKKVLYLDPFYPENAGTYYRINKWAEIITNNNYKVVVKNVYNRERLEYLLNKENIILFQLGFLFKRFWHSLYSVCFKTVIVRRTLLLYNEYGQGTFMERFLLSVHPNVILDIDDDLQIQDQSERSLYGKILLENKEKFYKTLALYHRFIVGSEYLKTLVLKYNKKAKLENIMVVPTCVDYKKYEPKKYKKKDTITFGWVGTEYNLKYLDDLVEPLNKISEKQNIKLLVISSKEFKNSFSKFEIENVAWSSENEIQNLLKIDIGLMPLYNTPVEKGKCGFKLIQYMGLGIVSIASAVTINREIVDDGINGFLVEPGSDWLPVFEKVLGRIEEFSLISGKARKKINNKYSFERFEEDYVKYVTIHLYNYTFKENLRKIVCRVAFSGFYLFFYKIFERTRNGEKLKPGITAVISAKNEEVSIELSLKSLLRFADQIICIDNGSDDSTWKIMNDFKTKNSSVCDITIKSMPGALLGDCREEGLNLTKHQWHLRWDADMIFKTSGEESSVQLRNRVLKTRRPTAFQLSRTNLYGDFYHTSKQYKVVDRGEPFLIKFSKKIKYKEYGKFDVIKLPIYYKITLLTEKYIFHCDGIKSNLRLIYRNCYFDWREKFNSVEKEKQAELSDFQKFEKQWQLKRYKTNDRNALIYRHQKECMLHYKLYDPDTYGEFPEIITNYKEKGDERFRILYKNGFPYIRTDSYDKSIENYIPTEEDLQFNPLEYLQEVLPEREFNKFKNEYKCVE